MNKKNQTLRSLLCLSILALLGVVSLYGQFVGRVRVHVPFKFVISKATLPDGDYTIERLKKIEGALLIMSADGRISEIFSTQAVQAKSVQDRTEIVFNRYQDHYFLSQIWVPGTATGRELIQSSVELKMAKSAPKAQPQTVSVAANLR